MDKKGYGGICEIVGLKEFQVKPYFDIDANFCPRGVFLGWLGGQRSNTVECSALPSGFEPGTESGRSAGAKWASSHGL